ncbi:MAG: hypothetical protein FWG98_13965 [Candidatus Cloacimonetes bacterium]|nr:hypothetical protein [Candidatus Cloacimonadota bacterium]
MKRILLFLTVMFACVLNAQLPVWTYDKDDPTDPSIINNEQSWQAPIWQFVSQDVERNFLSPFYESEELLSGFKNLLPTVGLLTETNYNNHNVSSIAYGTASDFNHSDGWHILSLFMGDSSEAFDDMDDDNNNGRPYVALYNIDRGIIRVFFRSLQPYEDDNENTHAFIEFNTDPTNNTGILSTLATGNGNSYTSSKLSK